MSGSTGRWVWLVKSIDMLWESDTLGYQNMDTREIPPQNENTTLVNRRFIQEKLTSK